MVVPAAASCGSRPATFPSYVGFGCTQFFTGATGSAPVHLQRLRPVHLPVKLCSALSLFQNQGRLLPTLPGAGDAEGGGGNQLAQHAHRLGQDPSALVKGGRSWGSHRHCPNRCQLGFSCQLGFGSTQPGELCQTPSPAVRIPWGRAACLDKTLLASSGVQLRPLKHQEAGGSKVHGIPAAPWPPAYPAHPSASSGSFFPECPALG